MTELVTMHDVNDWVKAWLGDIVERRNSNTKRWCARWFEHPEAVARIWQMYMGYRQVKDSGNALDFSQWTLDHLDRHIDRLMAADGPFAGCSAQRHSAPRQLEIADPPLGLWGPRIETPALDDHPTATARPGLVTPRHATPTPKHVHRPRH